MSKIDPQPIKTSITNLMGESSIIDKLQELVDDLDSSSSFTFSTHEKYFFFQLYNNIKKKIINQKEEDSIEFSMVIDLTSNVFVASINEIQKHNQDHNELIWKDKKVKEKLLDVISHTIYKELNNFS